MRTALSGCGLNSWPCLRADRNRFPGLTCTSFTEYFTGPTLSDTLSGTHTIPRRPEKGKGFTGVAMFHNELLGIVPKGNDSLTADHLNHDPLDNRDNNLRAVSMHGQSLNRRTSIEEQSGEKYVVYDKSAGKWKIQITESARGEGVVCRASKHLGTYDNEVDAIGHKRSLEKNGKLLYWEGETRIRALEDLRRKLQQAGKWSEALHAHIVEKYEKELYAAGYKG